MLHRFEHAVDVAGTGHPLELESDVVLAGAAHIGEGSRGDQFVNGAGTGLEFLRLVLGPLHCQSDIAQLIRESRERLADARLRLGRGVRGLDGLLLSTERVNLGLQLLRGENQFLLLILQARMLRLQIRQLGLHTTAPCERLPSKVLAPVGQRSTRLAFQRAGLLLQRGHLQFKTLTARGHIGDALAHLLQQLELPLVRVVEGLAWILGTVQRLTGLGSEDGCEPLPQTHGVLLMSLGAKWTGARRPAGASVRGSRLPGVSRTNPQPNASGDSGTPTSGKGRPTPTRKEAEELRKARLKADKATLKARARAEREKARRGLLAGDERYFPVRDRGPVKAAVRDYVDARFTAGELFIPAAFVILLASLIPVAQIQIGVFFGWLGMIVILLMDSFSLVFRIKAMLRRTMPNDDHKGAAFYGVMRALQMRRLRVPPARVRIGGAPRTPKA